MVDSTVKKYLQKKLKEPNIDGNPISPSIKRYKKQITPDSKKYFGYNVSSCYQNQTRDACLDSSITSDDEISLPDESRARINHVGRGDTSYYSIEDGMHHSIDFMKTSYSQSMTSIDDSKNSMLEVSLLDTFIEDQTSNSTTQKRTSEGQNGEFYFVVNTKEAEDVSNSFIYSASFCWVV